MADQAPERRTFKPYERVVVPFGAQGEQATGIIASSDHASGSYVVHIEAVGCFKYHWSQIQRAGAAEILPTLTLVERDPREEKVFRIERQLVRFYGDLRRPQDRRRLAEDIATDLERVAA